MTKAAAELTPVQKATATAKAATAKVKDLTRALTKNEAERVKLVKALDSAKTAAVKAAERLAAAQKKAEDAAVKAAAAKAAAKAAVKAAPKKK